MVLTEDLYTVYPSSTSNFGRPKNVVAINLNAVFEVHSMILVEFVDL